MAFSAIRPRAILCFFLLWRRERGWRPHWLMPVWLILIFLLQVLQIGRYYAYPHFSLHQAITDAAAVIEHDPDENKVLAGDSAILIAFAARIPVLDVVFRPEALPVLVKRQPPHFLFLEDPEILDRLRRDMPGYFSAASELRRYRIMDNYAHDNDAILYRIDAPGAVVK